MYFFVKNIKWCLYSISYLYFKLRLGLRAASKPDKNIKNLNYLIFFTFIIFHRNRFTIPVVKELDEVIKEQ